jgi:hypothetical protein
MKKIGYWCKGKLAISDMEIRLFVDAEWRGGEFERERFRGRGRSS